MPQTVSLQLPPGVVRGATPSDNPGRWFDANLVRWRGGSLQPVGGWNKATASPLLSTPRAILTWRDNGDVRRCAIACDSHIYIETASDYFNATPTVFNGADQNLGVGGYGTNVYNYWDYNVGRPNTQDNYARPFTFSLANWGEDLLSVHSTDGNLLRWTPTAPTTKSTLVSNAPASIRSMTVTPERHVFLGGYGIYPRRIAWSSREDYNDWNFASTTNTAGFLDLETNGFIMAVRPVRDGILVFSDTDVFLVRYVGQPFIYSAEKIAANAAPIGPQAIAVFDGRAAWMGREGFWAYEGGVVRSLSSDVGDFVFDNINQPYARFRACAGFNGRFNEVWFFYPTDDEIENNRYVIWSPAEGWWSIGVMARTAVYEAGVYRYPLMAGTDRHIYQHEDGWTDGTLTRVGSVFAETNVLPLGDDRIVSVTQAQPDSFRGAQATRFRFYSRFTREGAETAHGPFSARADGYMDTRLSARDIRLRVESAQDQNWTVGNMRLNVNQKGRR